MPNLLWFESEIDPEGYEILEFKRDELEFVDDDGNWIDEPEYGIGARPIDSAGEATRRLMNLQSPGFLLRKQGFPFWLSPRSNKIRRYRPLDTFPGLFMEFAELEETPDAVVGFANRFGKLGRYERSEHLQYWFNEILELRSGVRKWEKARKTGQFGEVIKLFEIINRRPHRILLKSGVDEENPSFHISPNELITALWLQLAQSVSANTNLRRCAWCPTWFAYGTGTGRRKSAHYCADRCRKAAHRRKKEDH